MDLNDMLANCEDQERGRVCTVLNPFTGEQTDIRIWIVGPDSDTARKSRLRLSDEILEDSHTDGTVSAENRERARINSLARLIKNWEFKQDGEVLPFTHKNAVQVLSSVQWLQLQVDAFAADRANFRSEDI